MTRDEAQLLICQAIDDCVRVLHQLGQTEIDRHTWRRAIVARLSLLRKERARVQA